MHIQQLPTIVLDMTQFLCELLQVVEAINSILHRKHVFLLLENTKSSHHDYRNVKNIKMH